MFFYLKMIIKEEEENYANIIDSLEKSLSENKYFIEIK